MTRGQAQPTVEFVKNVLFIEFSLKTTKIQPKVEKMLLIYFMDF
jgi:hypothetical protein